MTQTRGAIVRHKCGKDARAHNFFIRAVYEVSRRHVADRRQCWQGGTTDDVILRVDEKGRRVCVLYSFRREFRRWLIGRSREEDVST